MSCKMQKSAFERNIAEDIKPKPPNQETDENDNCTATMAEKEGTGTVAANQLVTELRATFETGRTKPLEFRIAQLRRLRDMLEENEEAFCEAIHKDLGRAAAEAKYADLTVPTNEIDTAIKGLSSWAAKKKVSKTVPFVLDSAFVQKEPLGVVLVISPWNYPIQLCMIPLVGAIAAGNCVVIKPSEVSQHTEAALASIIPQYLDKECYSVYTGDVERTTSLLAERFDHIFYTGNPTVGRIVMHAAANHLTPVTLELGGKTPCIIDGPNTDLAIVARRLMWPKCMNSGQVCISPDYALVIGELENRDTFVSECKKVIEEFYGEDIAKSPDYPRVINQRHFDRLNKMLEGTRGKCAVGGKIKDRAQCLIEPTLLTDVALDDVIMQDEIFGPILPVLRVDSVEDAVRIVRSKEKPLAMYLFSEDKQNVEFVLDNTSCGGVCVNDSMCHYMLDSLPFGGVGQSGMGRCHGQYSFNTFSHEKAVLHRGMYGEKLLWMRYPPWTERKAYWMNFATVKRTLPFM